MDHYLSNINNDGKYDANQNSNANKVFNFKLVLLGDTSVGKSCIVVRFAKNEFYEYQESTIGAAFMTQLIDIGECTIKFEIWDTAGQERYRSLAPMYYRGAAAAVIVYDITNKKSFEGAKGWIHELKSVHSNDIVIALAGNKCDLEKNRVIDKELAESFANSNNILFIETSAKTGTNVNDLFLKIAKKLPRNKKDKDTFGGIQINSTEEASKKCC
ncbi:rab family, other [Plasmodium vinckei petteri]|uniref:Rab family, other n=1 Tax=Plasmodium vinckei petteri TaxID=138298 RepID=W7AG31_PLAVN|nr:rab family, other [Plasmodium vinckei petteri]CAD2096092.1 ras-related protein Rab-5C, putative [Plasmodium vinckei petteri]